MIARLRLPVLLTTVAVVAMACAETEPPTPLFTGDLSAGNPVQEEEVVEAVAVAPEPREATATESEQLDAALEGSPEGCNVLDTSSCLLPFPSDFNSVEDAASPTGRRIDFPEGQLPNVDDVTFDPTVWNTLDGFSPSTPILVTVPRLDLESTVLPSEDDIAVSLTPESATVLINLDSGQLVPHWAELDSRASDPARRSLIIRPAVSLTEANRFAVALRGVNAAGGKPIEAPIAFKAIRDNITTDHAEIEDLRADYQPVFDALALHGVNRSDVYLAWWFTVASPQSLAGNVLSMRDDAMGRLNGGAPAFKVTDVITESNEDVTLRDGIAKVVEGTYEVPLYLNGDEPGATMVFDDAGKPEAQGTFTARFVCTIPTEAVTEGEARPVVYGHGLLGGAEEARSSHVQQTAVEINAVYCGTDAIGLADGDTTYAAQVAGNLSKFPSVSDRLQQAILNYLYLGRLLVNMNGFPSSEEFQTEGGAIMLNNAEAYWDGNSQGAILGGAVTAVAQDWTKAVLGVGGMGYSTLLSRSVDFDPFFAIMDMAYPDPLDQQVILGLWQMLWDRGETGGYVQHLTDRSYNLTPPHQVIMNVAFGDHQVATVTADNIARTLKIPLYEPALPDEVFESIYSPDDMPADPSSQYFFGLTPISQFPFVGSALFYWYSGTLPPPGGNITVEMGSQWKAECSADGADEVPPCVDPHEDPRRQPAVMQQKAAFFSADGLVINVCHDEPCEATPRDELDY